MLVTQIREGDQRQAEPRNWGRDGGEGTELQHVSMNRKKEELQQGPGNRDGTQGSQLVWSWQRGSTMIAVPMGTESASHHSSPATHSLQNPIVCGSTNCMTSFVFHAPPPTK